MDALIPLFVAIPLISAFLIMLLGKLIKGFHRFFAPFIVLVLLVMAIYEFSNLGKSSIHYTMGDWGNNGGFPDRDFHGVGRLLCYYAMHY